VGHAKEDKMGRIEIYQAAAEGLLPAGDVRHEPGFRKAADLTDPETGIMPQNPTVSVSLHCRVKI